MNARLLVLPLSLVFISACVNLKTRQEMREGDGELQKQTSVQRREETRSKSATSAKPLPPPPKDDDIDDQMRQLNGRVDAAENQVTQLSAAVASEKESVTSMAKAIDQKFLNYEEAIKRLEAQVVSLNEQVASMQKPASSSGVGAGTNAGAGAGAPVAAKTKTTSFTYAEDHFEQKKYKEAIVYYQKYRDENPKGKLYAEATYKIGMCFQELKLKDEAKAFFDEVIAKYPGSKEAKKAAFRSKQIK